MATSGSRVRSLREGQTLEYFTIAWNLLEAVVGLAAGFAAGSIALVGFALDSVVEASSGSILLWRLKAEAAGQRSSEEAERKAIRLVAISFFGLASYVGGRAIWDLLQGSPPEESIPGMVLAAVSLVVMPVLAARKRRVARQLDSRALRADSKQTSLCTYLSAFLLLGLLANAVLGWWWADPLAALVIAVVAAREGHELWTTNDLCCAD